jgi:hypothetical protein
MYLERNEKRIKEKEEKSLNYMSSPHFYSPAPRGAPVHSCSGRPDTSGPADCHLQTIEPASPEIDFSALRLPDI